MPSSTSAGHTASVPLQANPPPHAQGEGPLVCRMQRGRAQRQGGSPVPYVAPEPADTLSEDTPPSGQLPLLLWGAPEGSGTCYPSSSTEGDGESRGGGPRMQTQCGEPHKVRGFLFLAEGKQGLEG